MTPDPQPTPRDQVHQAVMAAAERGKPAKARVPPALYEALCKQLGGRPVHIGGAPVEPDPGVSAVTVDMAPAASP